MLGATGTIGQATLRALLQRGHEVVCFARPVGTLDAERRTKLFAGASIRIGDVTNAAAITHDGFCGEAGA